VTDRLSTAHITAGVFFFAAALVGLSITLAFAAPESQNLVVILFRLPGSFLVDSFHLASLYVPAILCVAAGLLLASRLVPVHLAMLLLSTLPFFTIATAFRLGAQAAITSSPITAWLVAALGRGGALAITAVLAVIELAAMVLLRYRAGGSAPLFAGRARSGRPAGRTASSGSDPTAPTVPMTAGMRRIRALLAAPSRSPGSTPPTAADERRPADERHVGEEPAVADVLPAPESLFDLPEPTTFIYHNGGFVDPTVDDALLDDALLDEDDLDEDLEDEFDDDVEEAEDFEEAERVLETGTDPDLDPDPDPPLPEEPLPAVAPRPRGKRYDVPVEGLLLAYSDKQYWRIDDITREAAETLRVTLDEFGIEAEVTGIRKGPVITMFEILPAPGVKLSKIVNLSDNIALRLAASSVRIVAPIPGKHAVGIEIPNRERAIVGFAELLQEESFRESKMEIPIALGKDIPGEAQIVDLTRMPHVLIAGATGSGKSVCVNSIICSILYRRAPHEVKLILIDPKIVELKFYNDIPHLLTPVITDPKRAFQALQYLIYEMERRYSLLDALQVRDIQSYNRKIKAKNLATEPIPYIVVVVDEFADLMATSGKELESTLARLAAMSRAVGIHLVLATQRPSTDVITGLIKANIPSRIAFMVASKVDSRIILDAMGADKLLGRGDMLFTSAWDPFPVRMQGAFLSEDEVERVVTYVKQLGEPDYIDDEIFVDDDEEDFVQGELEDPLMEKAIEIVQTAGKASASYLQRRLKVGYNRAARMVEEMERIGIVGPQQGSKPRDVIPSGDRY
jgi:DNA segregation ATPase FtsK/SpoIIIE, S-DNA-T family